MAAPKKNRASGPSGKHKRERRFLGLEADEWELVDNVTPEGEPWTKWVAAAVVAAAKARARKSSK